MVITQCVAFNWGQTFLKFCNCKAEVPALTLSLELEVLELLSIISAYMTLLFWISITSNMIDLILLDGMSPYLSTHQFCTASIVSLYVLISSSEMGLDHLGFNLTSHVLLSFYFALWKIPFSLETVLWLYLFILLVGGVLLFFDLKVPLVTICL